MKIALDMDGVLAEFNHAFLDLLRGISTHEFQPDIEWPTRWDWPQAAGYSPETIDEAWSIIHQMPVWWTMLPPTHDCLALIESQLLHKLFNHYDVTVVTNRPNRHATEAWLLNNTGFYVSVVTVKGDKGPLLDAMQIDIAIDDKPSNLLTSNRVSQLYLVDQPYNRNEDDPRLTRTTLLDVVMELTKDIPDDTE